jgi:hypothetical protein
VDASASSPELQAGAVGLPTALSKFCDYKRLSVAVPGAFFPHFFPERSGKKNLEANWIHAVLVQGPFG